MSSGGSTVSFQEMVQVREFSPYQKPASHSSCEEEEDVLVTVPPLTFDEEDEEMARVPPSSLDEEEKEMTRIPSLSLDEEDEEMVRIPSLSFEEIVSLSLDEEEEDIIGVSTLNIDKLVEVTEPHMADKKDKQQMDKESAKKISPRRRKRPFTWDYKYVTVYNTYVYISSSI